MQGEPQARGPRFRAAHISALALATLLLGGAGAGAEDACAEPRLKLEGWSVTVRASGPARTEPRATCVQNVLVVRPAPDAAGSLTRRKPGSLFSVRRD